MTRDEWQQVWTAYESASELPEPARAAYIASVLPPGELREKAMELQAADAGDPFDFPLPPGPDERPAAGAQSLIGQSIGRFQILAHLGRGGMGDVYSAFDPELGRRVAIKFIAVQELPASALLADPIREARAASALNHPGIITIFEVIRAVDTVAIVMELVEGQPMRALCGRPQALPDVARWGHRIAEALAATHAGGILHRDIKPENLIVRADGYVKILDFGLAAERASEPGGLPLGTLRYMSPEQACGQALTPATDIFSLGLVLYELATGVHPFAPEGRGNTTLPIAAAATMTPVRPPSALAPSLARAFDVLIVRMLDKDPARRPSAEAVAAALQSLPAIGTRRHRIALGAIAAACLAFGAYGFRAINPRTDPVDITATLLTGAPGRESDPAFSPDGRSIAYAWDGGHSGKREIWIKALDSGDPRRLTSGDEDKSDPCWLHGGATIAFLRRAPASYQVITIPASGGAEHIVTNITSVHAWVEHRLACTPDGAQVIVADAAQQRSDSLHLYAVAIATGERRDLNDAPEAWSDYWPCVSPDGRRVAFVRDASGFEVRVLDIGGEGSRVLTRVVELRGLTWSADSQSVLYQSGAADSKSLMQAPVAGGAPRKAPFAVEAGAQEIALSPGGRRVAYSRGAHTVNLWRVFSGSREPAELAPSTRVDSDGTWSPDGSKFAFSSDRSGSNEIWTASSDGTNVRRLTALDARAGSPAWSPDGRSIAFDVGGKDLARIAVVSAEGGNARRLLPEGTDGFVPSWSRDGKWIYFSSARTGSPEIWRIPSAGGPAARITNAGGFEPRESPDGRFLYYTKPTAGGLWRRSVPGGSDEEKVADLSIDLQLRCWDISARGIYIASPGPKPPIDLLPPTGDRRRIATLPANLPKSGRCLSAHPDGQSFLFPIQEDDRWEIYVGDALAR